MLDDGVRVKLQVSALAPTRLPGALMVLSYAAVTWVVAVLSLHLLDGQRHTKRWLRDGVDATDLAWAKAFDHQSLRLIMLAFALMFVGAVTTAYWSHLVIRNSVATGHPVANEWLGTFGWFIPIAWWFAGFSRLRRTVRADWQLIGWQIAFVVPWVAYYFITRIYNIAASKDQIEVGHVRSKTTFTLLRNEWILSLMFAGCFVFASLCALSAVAHLHRTFREIETTSAAGN